MPAALENHHHQPVFKNSHDKDASMAMFLTIADELPRVMPSVERKQIPNASHTSHSFSPSVYNETVLKFLTK